MKKRIIRILVVVIIIVIVISGIRWWKNRENGSTDGNLYLYGTIDIRDSNLAFPEQEIIDAILVEEGDKVEAGQALARLKTDRMMALIQETKAKIAAQQETVKRLKAGSRPQEIEQARARVASAKAEVNNAEDSYQRIKETSGTGATSDQALDDIKSRLEVARANLKVSDNALALTLEGPRKEDILAAESTLNALEAGLLLLNIRLSDMTLKAPATGIVRSRIMEPGEMAGPAKPVLTLSLIDPKWARVYVTEPDLGRISSGMPAKVYSDSFPGEPIEGWIGFISPTAEFTPKTVQTEELRTKLVYEVRVFVKDPGDKLRLGMPVTVMVIEK
jgi:HlyD family secretion protein